MDHLTLNRAGTEIAPLALPCPYCSAEMSARVEDTQLAWACPRGHYFPTTRSLGAVLREQG
jgi:hypothetical protein